MSSLQEYHINNQTINKTITSGREIALPQILIDAKNPESKAYVGSGKDYQLTNCTISSDGKKVIVNNGATRATETAIIGIINIICLFIASTVSKSSSSSALIRAFCSLFFLFFSICESLPIWLDIFKVSVIIA